MVAFHAQQAVEKSLKACLEEADIAAVKTHSLTRLYGLLEPHLSLSLDQDMLDRLEAVYIESRYPGEMGLLPYGKPTEKEAKQFNRFAQQVYDQIQSTLKTDNDSNSSPQETV